MRINKKVLIAAMGLSLLPPMAGAADNDAEMKLRGAIRGLVDELVKEGALPKHKADAVVERAMERAQRETSARPPAASVAPAEGASAPDSVRVPYIPAPVKQDIIEQIRPAVREDVVQDILKQARQERWGMPDAFPAWVNRIALFGDIRLREQSDKFSPDNAQNYYRNIQRINQTRTISGSSSLDYLNTTEDHNNMRLRVRLGMLAKVSDEVSAVFRIGTGSTGNPVSTNATFSNSFSPTAIILDQGYLRYQSQQKRVTICGGRVPNPFLTSELVWSDNLNFDGLTTTIRRPLANPNNTGTSDFTPFVTFGAFPLQVADPGHYDKWLYAAQIGADWRIGRSTLALGTAYYYFSNIVGRANIENSNTLDYTAPQFVQKGNTLYLINDPFDNTHPLYGLASDFHEVDLIGSLDIGAFGTTHVILTGHYVQNIGYNQQTVQNRILSSPNATAFPTPLVEDATGYAAKLTVGAAKLQNRGDWQVSWGYKRLGRDAVVDAYTDSDFHLGGTDAVGWILGGGYSIANNTWIGLRYLTSDAIQGPPLAIDTWQLDINARF